jgi:hypothetical protein
MSWTVSGSGTLARSVRAARVLAGFLSSWRGETGLPRIHLAGKPLLACRLFQQPRPNPGRCRARSVLPQPSRFIRVRLQQFLVDSPRRPSG